MSKNIKILKTICGKPKKKKCIQIKILKISHFHKNSMAFSTLEYVVLKGIHILSPQNTLTNTEKKKIIQIKKTLEKKK